MKVAVFGDVHGYVRGSERSSIEAVRYLVATLAADVFLQVGDLCSYPAFARPFFWIFGNNDSPRVIGEIAAGRSPAANLHHVPNGEVISVGEGDRKIRVAGLNGAYDPLYYEDGIEWDKAVGKNGYRGACYFTRSDVEHCLAVSTVDIFLAHASPAGLGFGREPDHAVPAVRELLDRIKPRYMFCGHAHVYREASCGGTRVFSLATAGEEFYILDLDEGELRRFATPQNIPLDDGRKIGQQ